MAPPHHIESIQKEGWVALAVSAIQKNQISSGRHAADTYVVPRITLQACLKGRQPRLGSRSKSRKLLEWEEELLIKWIYNMEQQGFPPHIIDVQQMALTLLTEHGTNASTATIGKQWVYRFVKKHPELDAHLARNYDAQ